MFRYQEQAKIRDGGVWSWKDIGAMTIRGPYALVIAALCFLTSMALLEGLNGPSWTILHRFTASMIALLGF